MDRFEQFKSKFPEFSNLSNGEIVNLVSQYTGADHQRVYSEFGGEQNSSTVGDLGTALKIGVQRLPETVTGLGDVLVAPITGRASISDAADSLGRATGFRPGQWANDSQLNYSPAQQQFLQQGAQTEGFADTAAHYLTNPMRSVVQGVESVPGMALGGVYARGLRGLGGLSNAARFGAGEGGVMAGQAMNQMVEDGVDPRRAAGYAAGVGALGGALGYGGGRLAERLGVVNPDELLGFGGRTALAEGATAPGLGRRVVGGMLSEGAFEEMPQSAMEAAIGNLAAERPWDQDVGKQAAAGLVLGGLMGGVVGVVPPARNPADPIDILNRDTTPQAPTAQAAGLNLTNLAVPQQGIFSEPSQVEQWAGIAPAPTAEQHASRAEDILAAFNTPVGEVGGRPVTAWEAFQREQGVPANRIQTGPAQIKEAAPKIDIPVPQPLQSDPVRSAVAQASPATLRKDGTLKDIVEKALGAYSEFSDGEIAAAIEEFAASKRKDTVWRVAALEAIARQRAAQGAPNVAQVDAASGQGAGTVPAGSAGNTPSGPVVLDGVRQPAGAPAPGSAARVPVGEPVVQQPSGLTEGVQPANVPPTQQVAPQAQTARGQEGAQAGAEQSRDAERAQVSRIFDTLSEREREILTKYHFDKMTFEEIGSELKERGESGTTRQRIEQQHKEALKKLAEAGRPFGLTQERLRLYFPDESRRMAGGADVQTASAAEVAQSGAGMTYRDESNNGAVNQANDEFEMADAVDGAEALDLDTDIAREEFDEGFRGEQGTDVDALEQVEAVESMARTERDHAGREITEEAVRIAGLEYDQDLQEGDVPFAQLDRADQIRYTKAAIAFNDEVLSAQQLMRVFGEIADGARQQASQPQRAVEEAGAVAQVQGAVPARDAGETQQETGAREEVTPTNPLEARVAALRDLDLGEKQTARLDKLVRRYQNREIDTERLGEELQMLEEQAFPEDRGGKGMRFSRTADTQGTTVEAVRSAINAIATPMGRRKVTVYQTADEAVQNGALNSKDAKGTQGWVDSKGNAFFIAGNIPNGSELAVVLHEIGAHLGIEKLLTDKQYEALVKKIFDWAQSDANTQESRIARAALARVESAKLENDADLAPETIAYFIEEAVKAGVNPTAMQYKTELGRWFRTLWAAFKVALRRLNLINADRLTAQNVVDLAYGAANLELTGSLGRESDGAPRASTNAFKRWFGDSKVVDENGNPLVVYHGTAADIEFFDPLALGANTRAASAKKAFFFAASPKVASGYAVLSESRPSLKVSIIDNAAKSEVLPESLRKMLLKSINETPVSDSDIAEWADLSSGVEFTTGANVLPVYLSMQNPLVVDYKGSDYRERSFASVVAEAKKNGHDGVIFRNAKDTMHNEYAEVSDIFAVFDPTQIKSAISNNGNYDPTDRRIRFSKINTSTPEGFFDAIRNRTADFFINPVGFMKEHGLGWLTLEQLADVVKSKSVSGYHRVMVAMQQFSKDRVHDAALIDVEWAKLSPNEQSRLSTVMRGATRASYDPENETPANDEQRTLNDQYEALTPAAKDIYLKVRDYYSTNFEERKQILLDAANRAKAAGKNTSEVERMFAKVKGPYFPLMRIGGWYSVGMSPELADLMDKKERNEASAAELKRIETLRKDAKHYVSRGHTTRRDAELSRRELQAQLGVAYANRAEERIGQEVAQLPDMAKLEEYLAPHLPVGVRSQVRDMLAQAYFDALPEKSALKRQLKREGVHGEEEDMRRVFAASALSSAHHISRLKYANDLSEAMVKVRAEGRRDETLRMVGNELNKRTALALEMQENPIVDRVLQVSYFANLGLSPAFLLTNMTQVPMITAPWLGARHGFAKATRALAEAFTDTKDMVRATYAGKGVKDGWRSEFDWSQKYPEGTDEHKLFRELLDRNLLDITMEHDLTAVAEVRNTKIDDAIKIANLPVRVTETVNRSITGLAAYRLARADGKSHEQAVEHAAKALSETQLNYSGLNTARHMQVVLGSKALARLMMQFRKFQQGMVYLIVKNAYDAVKAQGGTEAETKELRRIARKTLAGVFGTTGLMAGTLGLPFAGTVATVVGAVGGMLDDDDEPFDPVVEYRNFLTDMFGPEMAAVLAKGLPTLMNVDLSKRVGMGDIGTPLPFMRQGRTGTEAVNNTLGAAAGAWAGTTASMLDGIAFLANGDYAKAAEKIIPIKAAQNLVRGYRYDDQGLTNRNGELVVPAEKFSAWDIALRTAGFQPMREAEYYEANQAVEGAKRAAQDTRTKLLRQYAQAKLRGEPTADVDAEIKAFNERHPQKGLRIDYSARARAVQARRKMADERNEAGVRVDRTGALFEERGRFAAP